MQETHTIKGIHLGENGVEEDEDLTFCRQMGVEYVSALPPWESGARGLGPQGMPRGGGLDLTEEGYFDADALARLREHVESFGLKLGTIGLSRMWGSNVVLLETSERDRYIEKVCKNIEAAAKAGIPALLWYFGAGLGWVRSFGWKEGRGGVQLKYFDYDDVKGDPPHPAGPISAEQAWERIEYIVERVIPVAEEYKVKMACHPNDVPVPPGIPYRGIVPILNNIDGLKRYIDLHPSPYHGLVFCQGCISEFSTDPEQVYEAIRYFGSRQKIFWVHFRNIRGGLGRFEETFPDEGDIDMLKAMRIYKEVGYDGVITFDHAPHLNLDTSQGHRARAYCYGYIRALIQMVESEK